MERRSALVQANGYSTQLEGRNCLIREMYHCQAVSDKLK